MFVLTRFRALTFLVRVCAVCCARFELDPLELLSLLRFTFTTPTTAPIGVPLQRVNTSSILPTDLPTLKIDLISLRLIRAEGTVSPGLHALLRSAALLQTHTKFSHYCRSVR